VTTITAEGRRIRSNIVTGVVSILAIMVALVIVSAFGSDDAVAGPDGSSFVTTSLGTAGLYETLEELGAEVIRSRQPISGATLAGVDTLMALEVGGMFYDPFERAAIRNAVESGLTLVTSGSPNAELLETVTGVVPEWIPSSPQEGRLTIGTGTFAAPRFGVFEPGAGMPLVVSGDRHLAVVITVGDGKVVMFSDTASIGNEGLGLFDNAGVVVGQTGTGTVAFDEFRHGFTEQGSTGLLDAAPQSWSNTLRLLGAALVIALIAYGRRFGPPEPQGRSFVPSRRQLIDSVASTLRRTGSPVEATEPVRSLAKREIRRRGMLGPDATDDELRATAADFLAPEEVDAIFSPTPDTVMVADRALARLRSVSGDIR
jgi:hypothetical protein